VTREKSSPGLPNQRWRDAYLRGTVAAGTLLVTITEGLGAMHAVTRATLFAAWLLVAIGAILWMRGRAFPFRRRPLRPRFGIVDGGLAASIAAILAIVAFIAILSPPNTADAMAYHMPRVIYWVQQRSVDFFPTPYLK